MTEQNQAPNNRKQGFIEKLSPEQRKWVTIGGVLGIALLGVWLLTADDKPRARTNEVTNVLTDVSSRDMGIESLLAQIKISNDNVRRLENEIRKLQREQQLTREESSENKQAISRVSRLEKDFQTTTEDLSGKIDVLSQNLTRASEENARLKEMLQNTTPATGESYLGNEASSPSVTNNIFTGENPNTGVPQIAPPEIYSMEEGGSTSSSASNDSGSGAPSLNQMAQRFRPGMREQDFLSQPVDLTDPEKLFANAPLPTPTATTTDSEGNPMPAATLTTNFISATASAEDELTLDEPEPEMFIPAGSMLKGVLLAGLDAPTGSDARQDPFPVNVRIQTDAIMPNGWRADLKECFLLMSGYGDMSSERALLRGETLSCIKDDGAIIQAKLPSYAAGEDGKAGLRGRLVSKTGSILAKTLLAGFASGVSEAFDVTMTPTINTSSNGTVSYEQVYAPEAFQGAGISGISNALDRLADYYMSMAEEMFPIIEIDGGREVTVIVSNGATLTKVREADGSPTRTQNIVSDAPTTLQQ